MKQTAKKAIALALMGIMGTSTLAACGGGKPQAKAPDQHLEVYVIDTGYKTEGVEAILKSFGELDWVKAKYPNYSYNIQKNRQDNYALTKVKNPSTNEFDMLFTSDNFVTTFDGDSKGNKLLLDITESVYNSEVLDKPGVKYIDALSDVFVEGLGYTTKTNKTPKYFEVPYITGMQGISYSEEIFAQYGYTDGKTPNTTDELFALCDAIKADPSKSGNAKGYAFGAAANYQHYLVDVWWAQYDGLENWELFWQGKYKDGRGTSYSNKIFELEGRLKSLQVIEEMVKYDNGYFDVGNMNAGDFIQRQSAFLQGNYAMIVCADWFDTEMREVVQNLEKENKEYDTIRLMKMPVVSALTDKLETVKTDELLSDVITAIDNGATSYDGVSADDFARIQEARGIYKLGSVGHVAVIPTISNSQDVAVDVLKYMATEACQNEFMKATMGQNLPFDYDYNTMPEDVKAKISPLQKDRLGYYYTKNHPVNVLTITKRLPLVRFCSLNPFASENNRYADMFAPEGTTYTAQSIFDDTIAYWDDAKFDFALMQAGLK